MAIAIPEGFAFVPRRAGENVALALLEAAEEVGADRLDVRTVSGGYHVPVEVAEAYQAKLPEVDEADEPAGEEEANEVVSESADGEAVEIETEPVPDGNWTVAELEQYATEHNIALPADGKKADKLQAILDALPAAEVTPAE